MILQAMLGIFSQDGPEIDQSFNVHCRVTFVLTALYAAYGNPG